MRPIRLCIGICLLALQALAADTTLAPLLQRVEDRYNKAKTLQVFFNEVYTPPGKMQRSESGNLLLRKPGRMRWDYTQPKGKLFISDGKALWLYTPAENRAEKMKLKESEDMRAPLAFLLGKLHFEKEFRNISSRKEGADTLVTAEPKSDNLPYSAVEFLVTAEARIRRVKVTGFDKSILDFTFENEKVNAPLDSKLFQFTPPAGAQIVEAAQ